MSRYIDADKMLEITTKYIASVFPNSYEFAKQDAELLVAIEETENKTIDLVRCSECKYWNNKDCREGVGECEWAYYMTKPDDFCSYGERSE